MDSDKREVAGWWFFGIGMLLVTSTVFGIFGGFGKLASVFVERKVFEQSYQRSEGLEAQAAVLQAQLAEINAQLASEIPSETRQQLEIQKSAITAQLRATEGRMR